LKKSLLEWEGLVKLRGEKGIVGGSWLIKRGDDSAFLGDWGREAGWEGNSFPGIIPKGGI